MMIYVTNKHHHPVREGGYIGRPSVLGNPFKIGEDGDRLEVITKYRRWLWQETQHQGLCCKTGVRGDRVVSLFP